MDRSHSSAPPTPKMCFKTLEDASSASPHTSKDTPSFPQAIQGRKTLCVSASSLRSQSLTAAGLRAAQDVLRVSLRRSRRGTSSPSSRHASLFRTRSFKAQRLRAASRSRPQAQEPRHLKTPRDLKLEARRLGKVSRPQASLRTASCKTPRPQDASSQDRQAFKISKFKTERLRPPPGLKPAGAHLNTRPQELAMPASRRGARVGAIEQLAGGAKDDCRNEQDERVAAREDIAARV
jgi:hypothetical protein